MQCRKCIWLLQTCTWSKMKISRSSWAWIRCYFVNHLSCDFICSLIMTSYTFHETEESWDSLIWGSLWNVIKQKVFLLKTKWKNNKHTTLKPITKHNFTWVYIIITFKHKELCPVAWGITLEHKIFGYSCGPNHRVIP